MKTFVLALLIVPFTLSTHSKEPVGKELMGIDKFDRVIKEFADSIEKGQSKQSVEKFLKILKLQPNKEIIAKISELSGLKKAYPLAYSKSYDWTPIFSPDGKKILFQSWQKGKASENSSIYIMDIDGKNQREIVDATFNNASPMFSPDSQTVLFLSWREDTNGDGKINTKDNPGIFLVNIKSKQVTNIVSSNYKNFDPAFSPDGKYIIYGSIRSNNRGIYITNISTQEEIKISTDYYPSYMPVFSSDSSKIAFHTVKRDTNNNGKLDFNDNKAIIIYDVNTQTAATVIPAIFDNVFGVFSNNIKKIVFTSRTKKNRAIYISSIDGKSSKKLVNDDYDNEFLSFSPDNKKISYYSYRNDTNKDGQINSLDNRAIYVIETTGYQEEVQIAGNKYDNEFLSFYPDGKKVIFQSYRKDTNGDGTIDIIDSSSLYYSRHIIFSNIKNYHFIKKRWLCYKSS